MASNNRSLGIQIDQRELAGLSRLLANASVNIGQPEIAREIRQVVLADVDERFDRAPSVESGGVVYGGVYWPPLSQAYLDGRFFSALNFGEGTSRDGGQLLRDTGELQQSFTANGSIFQSNFNEVIVGTALPKARGLQFGVFWGVSRPELARPILFLHEQLADDVIEAIGLAFDKLQRQV